MVYLAMGPVLTSVVFKLPSGLFQLDFTDDRPVFLWESQISVKNCRLSDLRGSS